MQLLGHYFEGRRPVVDNIRQLFVAPLFLIVEVFAMLRWRRDLRLAEGYDGIRSG